MNKRIVRKSLETVDFNGELFDLVQEPRGKNKKFWVGDYLCKIPRSVESLESAAEVIVSRFCKEVGINAAEYHLASYHNLNNIQKNAVISTSYKIGKEDFEELSGLDIINIINKNNLENPKEALKIEHTIDFYMNAIIRLYPKSHLAGIMEGLFNISLLDYVVYEMDRHIENIAFLKYDEYLEVAPIFDCGNSLILRYEEKKRNNLVKQFKNTRKTKSFIDNNFTNSLNFGISTPLSDLKFNDYVCVSINKTKENRGLQKELNQAFVSELCKYIYLSKTFKRMFEKMQTINFLEFLKRINIEEKLEINQDYLELIAEVYSVRVKNLQCEYEKYEILKNSEKYNSRGISK